MARFPMSIRALALTALVAISSEGVAQDAPLPNPVLYLTGTEPYTANGQNFIRYRYDVFNKELYPAVLFAAAPSLPPCGNNTNAARSWVDFFNQQGQRLYGFCSLFLKVVRE